MTSTITLDRKAAVSLVEITRETVRAITALKVGDAQNRFVASNAVSIAQAYFEGDKAWFRAIYAADTPVGFLMLYDDPAIPEYFLWRFMIDARYQRLGFGRRALDLLVGHVRSRPNAAELGVSCVLAEDGPCPFYEKYGFVATGEMDDDELVMKLKLPA
ncbi:MAG TPA: GNAT family N-acetyltransferase [Caldilineaceae bacterium]|nr:GNAT family N-acetyltransferase [Caldilineaceae bacterium]